MSDPNVFRPKKLTVEDIKAGCITLTGEESGTDTRICVINEEFRAGFDFIDQFDKSVTCFGSARLAPGSVYYEKAVSITKRITEELHYAIITGGGPGIMEAANKGAHEAGGESVGMTIDLPMEQVTNKYVTHERPFYFFFSRKVAMTYSAEAYIIFPGGFGTMDEAFEILTLVQTKKIAPVPVIFVGEDFWGPLDEWIKNTMRDTHKTISPDDIDLYTITDDVDTILNIVKEAPIRVED